MNRQDGKNLVDGQRVQGWEGPAETNVTLGIRSVGVEMMQMGSGQSEATRRNSFHTHERAQTGPRPWLL